MSQRSLYRAKVLEAERDLELLKNQRRAFLQDEVAILPPSEEAKASQLLSLLDQGLAAFNSLHRAA